MFITDSIRAGIVAKTPLSIAHPTVPNPAEQGNGRVAEFVDDVAS